MSRQSYRRSEGKRVTPDELTVDARPVQSADEPDAAPGGGEHRSSLFGGLLHRLVRRDRLVFGALVALAALVRLPFLASRGSWDADQGHDMLVLRAFVHDGVVPLLGPPTSIGDFHHGAIYYDLLAPAALVSGADPTAVVFEIAVAGIAAVAVTWWLARAIGGPIAAIVAGLLMVVSPSAIETSTFIWNPNLIPLAAAIAYAAAWRARSTGHGRWWTVAVVAAGVVMQLHVLGVVFLIAILGVAVVVGARQIDGRRVILAAAVGLAVVAITYVPLLVHELQTDWSETRNVLAFLAGGRDEPTALDPSQRLLFTTLRAIGWPLVGLITDVPYAAIGAVAVTVALSIWRARAAHGDERFVARWFGSTLLWAIVALTVIAPSLATVIEGLPNDHYHAFLDPAVFVLVGLGAAALIEPRQAAAAAAVVQPRVDRTARWLTIAGLTLLVATDIGQWPPVEASDGGWPAARLAAERILATTGDRSIALAGLPVFKTTEGVEFPLRQLGGEIDPERTAGALVVVCDRLFERVISARCGGPAEERVVQTSERFVELAERFDLSGRTSISIYLPRQ